MNKIKNANKTNHLCGDAVITTAKITTAITTNHAHTPKKKLKKKIAEIKINEKPKANQSIKMLKRHKQQRQKVRQQL